MGAHINLGARSKEAMVNSTLNLGARSKDVMVNSVLQWDSSFGSGYGVLGSFVIQRPNIVGNLIIKEIESVWWLNVLWFGVEDDSYSLLVFSLILISYKSLEIILYYFNDYQLDYCDTTIECIGDQHNLFLWD